jgi:hypothetical protein
MGKKATLFGLIVALAVMLGFVSFRRMPLDAIALVHWVGYWQVLLAAGLFAYCLWRSLRTDLRTAFAGGRNWMVPVAVVLAVTAFLHVHERHEFKIAMDEIVLQDTAMRMHFARQSDTMLRGYELAGNFSALQAFVDKRPLFFPFLLSLTHDLTGYRVENVFVLNALLSLAFTGLVFLVGRRLGGAPAGYAGVLLVATIPLVHQNVTGGGFELLNLVMILAALWLGMRWAERPDTDRLGAFVLAGILLAQTRYESALFIVPVGLVILYVWWRQRAVDLAWPILVAPLLLVILPLHFNVFKVVQATWQLNDVPGAAVPFSPGYFYENVGHALNFFLSTDGYQPNSLLVSLVGAAGVGFFVLVLYREHRDIFRAQPAVAVFCLFTLGLMAHAGFMLCYFWGHFDDPIIRRLSLPTHLLFVLSFLFIYPRLVAHRARWRGLMIVTGAYLFACTIPTTAMHRYDQENYAARTNAWLSGFIDRLGAQPALAIDNGSALQWLIHRKASVSVAEIAGRPEALLFHLKNHSFDPVLVVQRMGADLDQGMRFPTVDDDLGDGFQLETVAEKSFSPVYHVRISRVVAVDEAKVKVWAQHRLTAVQLTPEMKAMVGKSDADAVDRWFKMLP